MTKQTTQKNAVESDTKVTPMMAQFIEIKNANADSLLFYRMGDFYELFFDDAEVASRALGITLTKRGKHQGADIPMCGVPVHAADDYLQKLIALGHKVAVCEQTEDPAEAKKRGSKSVVNRDVVRLVTPGTITEESLLDHGQSNYLAALSAVGSESDQAFAFAVTDISTGSFLVIDLDRQSLEPELARINPSELIIPDRLMDDDKIRPLLTVFQGMLSPVDRSMFDSTRAKERLCTYFNVADLDGFAAYSRAELSAAGAIIAYINKTQLGARAPLDHPRKNLRTTVMQIDAATRASLEITQTQSGKKAGSLLSVIDRTLTASGARLLANRLSGPLTDLPTLQDRHQSVAALVTFGLERQKLRETLKSLPDINRALSRIGLDRSGPRDLAAIANGLAIASDLHSQFTHNQDLQIGELLNAGEALPASKLNLALELEHALADDLPLLKRDGGFTRTGFNEDLDELRRLRDDGRKVIAQLQATYSDLSGIKSLKIKHNNVLGYFVDVNANHGEKLMAAPLNETFIHRQTLANAVRFTTVELGELEAKILSAGERALAVEQGIYAELVTAIMSQETQIRQIAEALAIIDCTAAFAELAAIENYTCPHLSDGMNFSIAGGRHPVVEKALKDQSNEPFIANNCELGADSEENHGKIQILTGPNMAGKSTFLRQNALIALMAQAGSFVPAERAEIGVIDRLFSRVGASDDLARGRSTFMVEMIETAAILNQATDKSLVILDEIGRGTATFDGLSIAWATIEQLHEVTRCRTLFATHYHELTVLSSKLERVINATVEVKEWEGDVIFMHQIMPGTADRSYGIQVARLAGLPTSVTDRAREVLALLEDQNRQGNTTTLIDDLPLFAVPVRSAPAKKEKTEPPALRALQDIMPDELSPKDALDLLYKLKSLL